MSVGHGTPAGAELWTMASQDTGSTHRVEYNRLMVFDHQPRDNQHVYFVRATDAPCIKEVMENLVLSQAVRRKSRELGIWDPPHRHNLLAKIEKEATDVEARRAQKILQERFNYMAKKYGKDSALMGIIQDYPCHVKHGVDYVHKKETPTVNRRVDRTGYVQTTSDGGETGQDEGAISASKSHKKSKMSKR